MASKAHKDVALRDVNLRGLIHTVRGVEVMLDSDLAKLYGVETKVFNQAVKRNIGRFPESFRFQLTQEDYDSLRSQFVTLYIGRGKHRKYLPYVFTEQGVAMLSAVLHSDTAIQTSIHIINAFVEMRRFLDANGGLLQRMDSIEKWQINHFPVLDGETVYHLGASLKNLGKKWFTFSRMNKSGLVVMERLAKALMPGGGE